MTKQEKIKEEIRNLLKPYIKDEPWKPETVFMLVNEICELMDRDGVVIKVDREFPREPYTKTWHEGATRCTLSNSYATEIYQTAQLDMLKAGYVPAEPLIDA